MNKRDIAKMLIDLRRDVNLIRTKCFDLDIVTNESWEASPTAGIFYSKDKIPMLKTAGVMKGLEYGWFRSNENNAIVSNALTDADKQLIKIIEWMKSYRFRPISKFSEVEASRFEVIEGGGRDSWLVSQLKGGAIDG